ncbi:MAG: N-formylglutamate amidohydrolase [Nannocystaceae bacterium]
MSARDLGDLLDESLAAEDVGLEGDATPPFVFTPPAQPTPLVISFPHVGLEWPEDFARPRPQVNFGRNADYEVHQLYNNAPALGAACVQARYTRLLIDLNRAPDDVSPSLVPEHPDPRPRQTDASSRGMTIPNRGVVWDTAVGNIPILVPPLSLTEFENRLARFYWPYHRAVELLLARRIAHFGHAILLEAHSMPGSVPGDLILGTLEGGSCAPGLERAALEALRQATEPVTNRLDVRLNDPYRGGELVRRFGRPEHGVHALQIEVNRSLYMDEKTLTLWLPSSAGSAKRLGSSASAAARGASRLGLLRARLEEVVRLLATPRGAWEGAPGRASRSGTQPSSTRSLVSPVRERINSRTVMGDAKERTRGSE